MVLGQVENNDDYNRPGNSGRHSNHTRAVKQGQDGSEYDSINKNSNQQVNKDTRDKGGMFVTGRVYHIVV